MDNNITNIQNDDIKNTIAKIVEPKGAIHKCSKCKKRKVEGDFYRNDKIYKNCNECYEKYLKKEPKEIKKIEINIEQPAKQSTDEILQNIVREELKNEQINTATENIDQVIDNKMKDTPLERINELEKLAGLKITDEMEYSMKNESEKVEYQKMLITKVTKLYENKMNPLSWMIIMGTNVAEKNAYLLENVGLDIDLTGYQKEVYEHKKDIDDVCLELMTEHPEYFTKYINNPFLRLSIILTQCGMNVALRNRYAKEKDMGSSNKIVV